MRLRLSLSGSAFTPERGRLSQATAAKEQAIRIPGPYPPTNSLVTDTLVAAPARIIGTLGGTIIPMELEAAVTPAA